MVIKSLRKILRLERVEQQRKFNEASIRRGGGIITKNGVSVWGVLVGGAREFPIG